MPGWFSTRSYASLGVAALLLAASPAAHFLADIGALVGIVWLLLCIVDLVVGPKRDLLRVTRLRPERLALRMHASLLYEIENRSRLAVRVGLLETPVRTLRMVDDEARAFVPARSVLRAQRAVVPVSRGRDEFGDLYLWFENPIGMIRRRVRIAAATAFRVYPDLSAVERYRTLHVRNRVIEAGLRRMRLRGQGTEFESLRDYTVGDAFRSIDWKATARRMKLMVAQHEVERSQNILLLLDAGRLMTARIDEQRKFDYAIGAGLSLAAIAGLANDRIGALAFAADVIYAAAPSQAAPSRRAMSDALCDIEPRFEEANYSRAFSALRQYLKKRSLIVFFTDAIDPVGQSDLLLEIAALARRNLVVVVFMNDGVIRHTLDRPVRSANDAAQVGVALDLAHERSVAVARLGRAGVHTIDVPAKSMSMALIDEYLKIKGRGVL
ncbi:MAG: DUF58 domain-containing protein [Vulcanimicrobiaceae bacterium]